MSDSISDSKFYRKLCAPKESAAKANADINAFYDELSELRRKYAFPDVLCIVSVFVSYDGGQTGRAITHGHNGAAIEAEGMAAYTLGQLQAERRSRINRLLAGNPRIDMDNFP